MLILTNLNLPSDLPPSLLPSKEVDLPHKVICLVLDITIRSLSEFSCAKNPDEIVRYELGRVSHPRRPGIGQAGRMRDRSRGAATH